MRTQCHREVITRIGQVPTSATCSPVTQAAE